MGNVLNKNAVLDRIKQFYRLKGNADLARFLGVAPNTITNWYSRSTFDLDVLYTKCVEVDFNWLLSGKRNIVDQEEFLSSAHEPASEYVQKTPETDIYYKMYKEKDEENKALLKEIGRLEERLEKSESSVPTAKAVSSVKSPSKKRPATSASVQSNK